LETISEYAKLSLTPLHGVLKAQFSAIPVIPNFTRMGHGQPVGFAFSARFFLRCDKGLRAF